MKRELGSAAGLLAILTVAIHTLFPPGSEGGGGSRVGVQEKKSSEATKGAGSEEPEMEGPWITTRAFFNASPAPNHVTSETVRSLLSPKSLPLQALAVWRKYLGLPE